MSAPRPLRALDQLRLTFKLPHELADVDDVIHHDLSAIEVVDQVVWAAGDETATVERLVPEADGHYGAHRCVRLGDFFPLPGGRDGEMDIEGMAYDAGYLYVCGSHSSKRKKAKLAEKGAEKAVKRLAKLTQDRNRYFIGRLPLVGSGSAVDAVEAVENGIDTFGSRRAAWLPFDHTRHPIMDALADDPHLAPFMAIPCKENGFDIEGLAARGDLLLLGLRGPVLRGYAVILAVRVAQDQPGELALVPFSDGALVHKHFLDLDGLGIRELLLHGGDLLLLTGPTMDHEGPMRLYRWGDALGRLASTRVVPGADLSCLGQLPSTGLEDKAEGMSLWRQGAARRLLIAYDAPSARRCIGEDGLMLDIVALDGRP